MIAIKDMEMPKNCIGCPMFHKLDGDNNYQCIIMCSFIDSPKSRADGCPLVEIITCKDCKHRDKVHPSWLSNKKDEVYFCTLQSDEYCYEVEDDFYCKDAERRE